ncbi:MAG: hypothetical protein V4793_31060, partial [Paraburkholderia tropica]
MNLLVADVDAARMWRPSRNYVAYNGAFPLALTRDRPAPEGATRRNEYRMSIIDISEVKPGSH